MSRFLITVLFGALLGASLVFALMSTRSDPAASLSISRDILVTSDVSRADAEHLRERRYEGLETVQDVMALPTAFARTEAMYALAGRANAGRLQALLFDALRIADDSERSAALEVLFFRLVDVDPKTALALSRLDAFSGPDRIASMVWRRWSVADLDAALLAASEIDDAHERNVAAQAMFDAHGHMHTPDADRIAAALGIQPDGRNQSEFVTEMLERSLDEAIAYLNGLPWGIKSRQVIATMASHFASRASHDVTAIAGRIEDLNQRQMFEQMLASSRATQNPEQTLRNLLASGTRGEEQAIYAAAQELAAQDLALALRFFDESMSPDVRGMIGAGIAQSYAQTDPAAAIEWAKENSNDRWSRSGQSLLGSVLGAVARSDPDLAMVELQSLPANMRRDQIQQQILMQMGSSDPERALTALDSLEYTNSNYQRNSRQMIVGMWSNRDPGAASAWILANRSSMQPQELAKLGQSLAHADVESAMRVLSRLEGQAANAWRRSIASQLVNRGSIDEAQAFISQFEGSDDYPQLQGQLIMGLAVSDPTRAEQLAQQMPSGQVRDLVLSNMMMRLSMQSPQSAVRLIDSIEGERARSNAISTAVQSWSRYDPAAASRWVLSRPSGRERDGAIVALLGSGNSELDVDRMLRSVGNPEQRHAAESNYIMNLAHRDPGLARDRLARSTLPEQHKQRIEAFFRQQGTAGPGALRNYPSY